MNNYVNPINFNGQPMGMNNNNPFQAQPMYPNTGYPANPYVQKVNNQSVKINPQVMALINPIIDTMTEFEMYEKSTPAFGMWDPKSSVNDPMKKKFDTAKKQCVHLIRDTQTGELIPTLEEVDEFKFRCRVCGREVYKKFDQSAVEKLQDAIPVLNQLAFFGMSLNITPEHMSKIIFLKETMNDAIQLMGILNKFVKEEENANSSTVNIGEASRNAEFRVGNMLTFGSF